MLIKQVSEHQHDKSQNQTHYEQLAQGHRQETSEKKKGLVSNKYQNISIIITLDKVHDVKI